MKACPFCAEEIQDAAIVCKHCRRDLDQSAPVNTIVRPAGIGVWKIALGIILAVVLLFFGSAIGAGILEEFEKRRASSEKNTTSLHQTLFDLASKDRPAAFLAAFFPDGACDEIDDIEFKRMDPAGTAHWRVHCANNNRTFRVEVERNNVGHVVNCEGNVSSCF